MSERRRVRPPVTRGTARGALRPQRRRFDPTAIVWLGAGVLLLVVTVLVAFGLYTEYYVPPRETVLTVGNRSFNLQYLVDRTRYNIMEASGQGRQVDPSAAIAPTLDALEREELIRQLGPAEGLTADATEIEQTLRTRTAAVAGRAQLPSPTPTATSTADASASPSATATTTVSDDDFKASLRDVKNKTGLSDAELRDLAFAQTLQDKLRQNLSATLPPTAPQVQFLTILVDTKDQADGVKKRLDAGADFEALQAEVSPQTLLPPIATPTPAASPTPSNPATPAEPAPKVQRQDPLWFIAEMVRSPFSEPIFRTPVGQYSDVISSDRGYAIFKIVSHDNARPLDTDQREVLIERALDDWRTQRLDRVPVKRSLDAKKTKWALSRISG